jgi:hypothetical protein
MHYECLIITKMTMTDVGVTLLILFGRLLQ